MTTSLRNDLYRFTAEFGDVYDEVVKTGNRSHSFGHFIRKQIPSSILQHINSSVYKVEGSCGRGNWTPVPWVAVFDTRITSKASSGVYIVYLLNKDTKTLFLTLNQATTEEFSNETENRAFSNTVKSKNKKVLERLEINASHIRSVLGISKSASSEIDCGSPAYNAGCICYKKYTLSSFPSDSQIESDLAEYINLYESYYEKFSSDKSSVKNEKKDGEMALEIKNNVENIKAYIASKGFSYSGSLIENFYLSIKTKPFVILAGTSGTGKTKLVRLFAEAIGANYKLVSVRPDWSDSSDLFGHVDLNGKFNEGVILSFVKDAEIHPNTPFFLCLDEMNLARVEYYLSDILSVIETREMATDGRITTDPLVPAEVFGTDDKAKGKFGVVSLPDNLYIVGTVNMDETTFPFSKKVLDRANTIEFSYVDLMPDFDDTGIEAKPQMLSNDFLKTRYLVLKQDCAGEAEYVTEKCEKLQAINEILKEADAHIGYRVRDEIVFYMLNNRKDGLLSEEEALDNEIMQKILPRVQGGSSAVKNMLMKLFIYLAGDYSGYADGKATYEQMRSFLENKGTLYPRSAEKVMYMVRRYEEDGFTSYWL